MTPWQAEEKGMMTFINIAMETLTIVYSPF